MDLKHGGKKHSKFSNKLVIMNNNYRKGISTAIDNRRNKLNIKTPTDFMKGPKFIDPNRIHITCKNPHEPSKILHHRVNSTVTDRRKPEALFNNLSVPKNPVVTKPKSRLRHRIKYSLDLSSNLPNLINEKVKENRVKQTIINLNRANIYGIKIREVPCLYDNLKNTKPIE